MLIEKNVPMPDEKSSSGIINILKSMEIGDSIIVPKEHYGKIHPYAKHCAIKVKMKTIDGKTRAWRIA